MTENRLQHAETIDDGRAVAVTWTSGRRARFHAVWLRDNALDAASRDTSNGQRLVTLGDQPAAPRIGSAGVAPDGGLDCEMQPEARRFLYPADWLERHIYDCDDPQQAGRIEDHLQIWDAGLEGGPLAPLSWDAVARDDAALADWLERVRRYGFARLCDVPVTSGAVCEVVSRFGFVRETNYGRWFDVRATPNPVNLADTARGLQAHTDNPYREPVPTLQLLHCLENDVRGGANRLVDGFALALRLQREAPEAFELLTRYSARFEFAGTAEVCLRARRPLIQCDADGLLRGICFNNRSAAPLTDIPYSAMPAYYGAIRHFAALLDDPAMSVSFLQEPGDLFIVDNRRVLHARDVYEGGGTRWLQGCYADMDGLTSRLNVLRQRVA